VSDAPQLARLRVDIGALEAEREALLDVARETERAALMLRAEGDS
jgi:hypothetical protein